MSKSNTYETALLALLLNGTGISNIADNTATSPTTALWAALHTSDPADTGTQGTNEVSYTGYARVLTQRSTGSGGWSVSAGAASPVSAITFPQATSTSTGTITHFSLGLSSASTSGVIYYSGAISPSINYGSLVTPALTTASQITED
jgi:hypothetical protein